MPEKLTLYTHTGQPVEYPRPKARATFNESTGDGVSWAAWTWNPVTGCLHGCDYCLTPDTPVLTATMTCKPLGDIRPGDQVVAFDETAQQHLERRWRIAEVTDAWRTVQRSYRIVLGDGREIVASGRHKWLCSRTRWRTTAELAPGHRIRTIATITPDPIDVGGKVRTTAATVVRVIRGADVEMVDITTSTGTFVADGLLTHNCYARSISARFPNAFPAGFTPLFHEERLDAPANTRIPAKHTDDPAWVRVFVCSMADLYGRWVPQDWIDRVHAAELASPRWEYLHLTKFPGRYVGLPMPPDAWVGTSVDEQKRVRIAEDAMWQVDGVKVKWLSLEPLREQLTFADLSMFDWIVIGAQTETRQPGGMVPAFAPPLAWVLRLTDQAREAGCRVHWKPNLRMVAGIETVPWVDEYPAGVAAS